MRRLLAAVPLLLTLSLTAACGDDDGGSADDEASPSESSSASESPSESASEPEESTSSEPTADTTQAVTEKQFCDDAEHALHGGSTDEVLQQVATVVANGLPEEMPQDAVDGIQVLIDIAPDLEQSSTALKAFQGLSGDQLGDVAQLAGYLTKACGKNLVADIVPGIKDLPSDLKSLLPSELTAP